MKLNPYIHFPGEAQAALDFYCAALGGEIIFIKRYGDSPMPCEDDYKNKIMHARFQFDGNLVMISDAFKGQEVKHDGNVQLSIEVESLERMNEVFGKMAEGGKVTLPPEDTFWGARFGMLQDKFGVSWMFNHNLKK